MGKQQQQQKKTQDKTRTETYLLNVKIVRLKPEMIMKNVFL